MANRNLGSASHLAQFPPELQNIIDHSQWYVVIKLSRFMFFKCLKVLFVMDV